MSLFKNENAVHSKKTTYCLVCEDRGFVGCDEAIAEDGTFITVAWDRALPCFCPAGEEFERDQETWLAIEAIPQKSRQAKSSPGASIQTVEQWKAMGATYDPTWWGRTIQHTNVDLKARSLEARKRSEDEFAPAAD